MKSTRSLVMIGISIIIAIIAVVLATRWIARQSHANTKEVVVASMDINMGTRLTPEMLTHAKWPSGSVLKGSFLEAGKLDARVVKVNMQRGELFTESKLAPVGATGGLSAVVKEGKRAMTVRVNDVVGVAGFALPGNYVDILVSTKDETKSRRTRSGQEISKMVLERILVLAVAQEVSQDQTKPKVVNAVTLEVTPEEAEKLDLARSIGTLSLMLRNQIDNTPAKTAGATKKTLLHGAVTVAKKPVQKRPRKKVRRYARKRWCQEIITGPKTITKCYYGKIN